MAPRNLKQRRWLPSIVDEESISSGAALSMTGRHLASVSFFLKNGLSGERPIFRKLLSLLRQYLDGREDDEPALFIGLRGRLKKRRIQQLFTFYAVEAGLPIDRRHVHVLRHSAAVHALDAGEHIDFVRDHMGHRSIQASVIYGQVSDARRTRTMRRLERSRDFPIPS